MKRHWIQIIFATIYFLFSLSIIIKALLEIPSRILYYTFQGNIFCLIVMFLDLCYLFSGRHLPKSLARTEFAATIAILTIGVVFCTILYPISDISFWTNLRSLSLHFIFPILFPAYTLIFRHKEMPTIRQVFWCLVPPLVYIGFVHIRNLILGIKWYPYFFTDISKIGIDGFLKWVGILFGSLLIVGSLFLLISRLITKSGERRSWAKTLRSSNPSIR